VLKLPIELDGPPPVAAHVAELISGGDVVVSGNQVVRLGGAALALQRRLLSVFRSLAAGLEAEERAYPVLIPAAVLARTDYFISFPHQATVATHLQEQGLEPFVQAMRAGGAPTAELSGRLDAPEQLLSPAVCYHCYAELSGVQLSRPLEVLTATGRCFRREDAEACLPLARQREFTMHEIVLLGRPERVTAAREQLLGRVLELARRVGLRGRVVQASDPFYGSVEGRARSVLQQAGQLKLELVVDCGDREIAIASFNRHEDYFGRAFSIESDEGKPIHTSCIAFGVDRWMRAVVAARGASPAAWTEALSVGSEVAT
jgi:seryl-tRNA synthetase